MRTRNIRAINSASFASSLQEFLTMHRTIEKLRAEFLEMPGLRLTAAQVQRLCGVDQTACRAALNALVDAQFLHQSADGTYARRTEGEIQHPWAGQGGAHPVT
jgi:hypothetical protein